MNEYWSQWSSQELLSMQGVEQDEFESDELPELDYEIVEESECPRCSNGCNYCLMTDY